MKLPTLHLTGTSRSTLAEGYEVACNALRDALAAVQDAAPNTRDYYPQGEGAYTQAQTEHGTRIARLTSVLFELQQIQEHVATHA